VRAAAHWEKDASDFVALIAIVILASFEVDIVGSSGCIIFVLWLAVGFSGGDALSSGTRYI
jgi:hypothetical protein